MLQVSSEKLLAIFRAPVRKGIVEEYSILNPGSQPIPLDHFHYKNFERSRGSGKDIFFLSAGSHPVNSRNLDTKYPPGYLIGKNLDTSYPSSSGEPGSHQMYS